MILLLSTGRLLVIPAAVLLSLHNPAASSVDRHMAGIAHNISRLYVIVAYLFSDRPKTYRCHTAAPGNSEMSEDILDKALQSAPVLRSFPPPL